MDNAHFDSLMNLFKFASIVAAATIGVAKYFKYLETKATERSVGSTKIKEFEKINEQVKADIEDLQTAGGRMEKDIDGMRGDYRDLVKNMLNFIGRKP